MNETGSRENVRLILFNEIINQKKNTYCKVLASTWRVSDAADDDDDGRRIGDELLQSYWLPRTHLLWNRNYYK